jgi:RimJ/RimL family protein N-acetyltransferase
MSVGGIDLHGRIVRLESLTVEHAEPLLLSARDPEVWAWKPVPQPQTIADMRRIITENLMDQGAGTRQPFAVVRLSDEAVVGSTTLFDLDRTNRRVEMGWTWLARSCWGQGYNEDKKRVLLAYCFEHLGLARVAWSADALNVRSNNALERLGFTYEGTLRSHAVRVDGSRRDSVFYSLLADEWPANLQHLHALIDARSTSGT